MYEEYTLRDGTIKTIKKVKGRSLKEEMKLLGISERDILSIQSTYHNHPCRIFNKG
jgi:hypothetical protein